MTNPNPITADVEAIADAVVDKLLAKVPFLSAFENEVNDALNAVIEAAVAKVETEIKNVFHL